MSNYTKTTDFEAKDSLPTGDSGKIIRGAEFETEFDAIATAITTKADTAGPTFTGTLTFETISDGSIGVTAFVDEDNMASDSATLVPTQQSVKAYVDSQVTAQDLDFQADSGGALSIDLDSEALTLTGGTGINTSGSGNAVTFAIDSTVATLTGSQTLTNKTLTSPDVNTPDIDGGTIDGTVIGGATPAAVSATTVSATGNITVGGTVDGRDVAADGTKLDGVEAGATADQTAAEIRTLVESATDSNVFTDADHSKLDGIEASATADQTAAEIRTLVESASDSNVFTDADHTKLNGIEAGATGDQTNAEIRAAVEAATDSNVFTDADHTKLDGIEASADVTDTTNVTAAGALMDSELTNLTAVKSLNQGVATTDSPTFAGLTTTANINFGDNDKAIFGAGSDLQIYHDGNNSYVDDTGTGALLLKTNGAGVYLYSGSEALATFNLNGAANLYYDNSLKLSTTSTGIDVTGEITADGLALGDSQKATFGASDDLQIYHDGTHSNIKESGAGDLQIFGDNVNIYNAAGSQNLINLTSGGANTLFHSGSAKLSTTSTGIDVTGTATMDGLVVDGNISLGAGNKLQYNADRYFTPENNVDGAEVSANGVFRIKTGSTPVPRLLVAANGDISFYEDTGTTPKLFWDASAESLGIGTSSPANKLHVMGDSSTRNTIVSNVTLDGGTTVANPYEGFGFGVDFIGRDYGNAVRNYAGIYSLMEHKSSSSGGGDAGFKAGLSFYTNSGGASNTNPSEKMRIDHDGNLLVGKTALNTNTAGLQLESDGYLSACRDGGNVVLVNRKSNDGALVTLQKDGTTVGSIGTDSGAFVIHPAVTIGTGLWMDADHIEPTQNDGTRIDDSRDFGSATYRWDDIYATNGTIQTSDRNEKQDIEALSEAEQRVAVACKGLLRKFRWKSSVADKGDDARIHFGIIAQDLQDAFTAEGLDAGRYAMFISTTWTDEDTGEERTRMGVRYSELLAFIIAAI